MPCRGGSYAARSGPLLPCGIRFQTIVLVQIPETYYARTVEDLSVAYQTVGNGPPDVLFLRGWHTNVEHDWEERVLAHVFRRIASFGRLILIDRRGTGLSDRIGAELPTLEQRMEDIRAVLDAVGSSRAALVGLAAASMLTATFAATYPDRTQALVLYEPMPGAVTPRTTHGQQPWIKPPGTGAELKTAGVLQRTCGNC